MTDDNKFKLRNEIINDYTLLKDLYDKIILENKNLKERLSKYTNSDRKKNIIKEIEKKLLNNKASIRKCIKAKRKLYKDLRST